jgi:hypothetical protein
MKMKCIAAANRQQVLVAVHILSYSAEEVLHACKGYDSTSEFMSEDVAIL